LKIFYNEETYRFTKKLKCLNQFQFYTVYENLAATAFLLNFQGPISPFPIR